MGATDPHLGPAASAAVDAVQRQAEAAISAVQQQAMATMDARARAPLASGPTDTPVVGGGGRVVLVGVAMFLVGALLASLIGSGDADETVASTQDGAAFGQGEVASGAGRGVVATGTPTTVQNGRPGAPNAPAPATGSNSPGGGATIPPAGTASAPDGAGGGGAPPGAGGAPGPEAPAAPAATTPPVSTGPVRGVTDTAVKIGSFSGDYTTIGAACPRCGNGDPLAPVDALLDAWRRDGLLPVHGRDIDAVQIKFDGISAEQTRAACVQFTQEIKPFLIIAENVSAECPAKEFGYPTIQAQIGGMDEANMPQAYPNYFVIGPTIERIYRNTARWAQAEGLLDGQVLGMFSPSDALIQGQIDRGYRTALAALGHDLAVDFVSEGQQDEAVAVQRMRSEGVTTVLIPFGSIGTPIGFQAAARNQGWIPRYVTQEATYEMNDAVADTAWDIESMHGQLATKTREWDWAVRKPATPLDNPAAAYCLRVTQEHLGKELDVYDHTAQIEYTLLRCSALEVIREAMVRAGPGLTEASFIAAVESIQGMQTSSFRSSTFGPGIRHSGGDMLATATFDKNRHQPANAYWQRTGDWQYFTHD